MCYDGQKVLLFGGEDQSGNALNDTWVFDITNGWVQIPVFLPPIRRAYAGLAYDVIGKRPILFGGRNEDADFNDTWEYKSHGDWHLLGADGPSRRSSAGMAYDGKYIVLSGGMHNGEVLGDTWIFHGAVWEQVTYPQQPFARAYPAMAVSANNEQATLFGGAAEPVPYSDMWLYTSTNPPGWTSFAPATSPPLREGAAMVGGSFLTDWKVQMFGGYRRDDDTYYDDTWGFYDDDAGGNWQPMDSPTAPPARAYHGMALVTGNGAIVMFGGKNASGVLGDTWIYDNGWTEWQPQQR